ncbi:MAG TPA: AsmA family protein, partial [Nitrospiraceae bacterium]|nr:AsmA family protein [Nitrospiraceae bacterium]
MKVLLALVVALLLLIGALHLWLDSFIKRGAEQVVPKITQTSVTLRDVDISLLLGRATLEDLTIGNPKGFQMPSAFRLHNATVHLDWRSVLSDTIVIEEILIDGPEITFEGNLPSSNLGTIRDNAKAFSS